MITVIGIGCAGSPEELGEDLRALIRDADLVVGAARHLGLTGARRTQEFGGDLEPALTAIEAAIEPAGGAAVVLASGDPGFFGIVRALGERFGRQRLRVLPAVSSVAAAFARAGMAWDDALVVSAHGRDPRRAVNACRAHPKVAVLTSPGFGPAELAAGLAGLGRRLLVAEGLGEAGERVVELDPGDLAGTTWSDRNVVVVFDESRATGPKGWVWPRRAVPSRWALPEPAFEHAAGLITKWEVRALALARLGPGVGDLVWDVGAGSGSVAIECARFGAAAVSIEREAASCERIGRNAAVHGVDVAVVRGEAPEALTGLPAPDAVFVGGTGGRFEAVLAAVAARALRVAVVALVGLDRVSQARVLLEAGGLHSDAVLVQAARLEPVGDLQRLAPTNPVFLVCGVRP